VSAAVLGVLAVAAARFVIAGVLPALDGFRGDFGATFPSEYFARLRPEWPAPTVWGAPGPGDPRFHGLWFYGPMMHFITLPLFAVPEHAALPAVWAGVNVAALVATFILTLRLLGGPLPRVRTLTVLAALWMGFQPLVNCLAQGNIEIVELALLTGGLAAVTGRRQAAGGLLVGVATMIKYLPIGFVVWLGLRSQRRAALAAVLAMAAVALVTQATLGWENNTTVRRVPTRIDEPQAGFHELSITSAFLHRAGSVDSAPSVVWRSPDRRRQALIAGLTTSGLIGLAYAALVWRRRRAPVGAPQVGVLMVLMVLLPPWNHDYYYVFLVVPLTVAVVTALRRARYRRTSIACALMAVVLMSPPVPYGMVDRLGWFDLPFAYLWNFSNAPVVGALLLLGVCTMQWLTADPVDEWLGN
jgi:hypothetical protein